MLFNSTIGSTFNCGFCRTAVYEYLAERREDIQKSKQPKRLAVGHKHTCEDGYSPQILRQADDSVRWQLCRRKKPTEQEEETS